MTYKEFVKQVLDWGLQRTEAMKNQIHFDIALQAQQIQ